MFQVTFTLEEVQALNGILERELRELHSEIHHTDDRAYREGLKERERLLRDMLVHVETPTLAEGA